MLLNMLHMEHQLNPQVVYENQYTYKQIQHVGLEYYISYQTLVAPYKIPMIPYQTSVAPFQTSIIPYQTLIPPLQMLVVSHQMSIERQIHYVELVYSQNFGHTNNTTCNDDNNDGTSHSEGRNDDFIEVY